MRHPDAANIVGRCEAALPRVLEAAGLPGSLELELDREGWVNVCWLGRNVVVRFNARDPHLPKFRREEWAYRALRDLGFPVPRTIAHIDDRKVAPYPVLVVGRLPGENLEATWKTLSSEQQARLAGQAGRWLARLHKQEFVGFGEVFGQRKATQQEFWSDRLGMFLAACERLFDERDFGRLTVATEAVLPTLDAVQESRLVHGDYHFGNLLHDGTDIAGILDFEWAMASDR
jgi:aminoglycoside phosphotransferase (APT) family kinase protein